VLINQDITIYYPNAFTPNGDAFNPGWRPEGTGIDNTHYQCYIYDRWGKMIWKTNDFYAYWYGTVMGNETVCELGVYTYIAYVMDVNGNSYQFTGSITLVK
jgi:gliding motility-associated-like protein